MASRVDFVVQMFEPNLSTTMPRPTTASTCTIQVRIRCRYQLKVPTNEGRVLLIEDLVTPELCKTFRIPVVFPLSMWRELYLSDVLKSLRLDAAVHNSLKGKIEEAVFKLANRCGNRGISLGVKIGILRSEMMAKEEVDRIANGLMKEDGL